MARNIDHEERWLFLDEVCFFRNLGYKRIKKYPSREILKTVVKSPSLASKLGLDGEETGVTPLIIRQVSGDEDDLHMFVNTEYIRKYMQEKTVLIVHEADACFYEPLEAFLGFLMYDGIYNVRREARQISVPFPVVPYPSFFMHLCLDEFFQSSGSELRDRVRQCNDEALKRVIVNDTKGKHDGWSAAACSVRDADWFLSMDFGSLVEELEEFRDHRGKKVSDYTLRSGFLNDPLQYNGRVGEIEVTLPEMLVP